MTASRPGEPLTYPLASLLREAPGAARHYQVAGVVVDVGPDLRLVDPVEGTIRVGRTNRGVLVHGRLETAIAAQCSRCLTDLDVGIDLEIDEEAVPSIDFETGRPLNWPNEPDVLHLNAAHELELDTVVRDAILLAEPIAPLCRSDCPGLCAMCGEDLAITPHSHPEEVDPRMEALRGFRFDGPAGTH